MAKKRKTTLPRVTVLAYNRRDLLAFITAVEKLSVLVGNLEIAANAITKRKASKPAAGPTSAEPPTSSL